MARDMDIGFPASTGTWEQVSDIHTAIHHTSLIFPGDTDLTCTLTALAAANTFSSWAEIEDDTGGTPLKLSALFASYDGHITSMLIENVSQANTVYILEISYGSDKTIITQMRFAGGTKFQSPDAVQRLWAPPIPVGETVYYRMKTATSVADTCDVHFRCHLHN